MMNALSRFDGGSVLVTGGAGFVGSNLVRELLKKNVRKIHIVDNLLSSERENIPNDERIIFTKGSIADDKILAELKDEYSIIFHLCTFHGNQNSIQCPIADHDNNLLPTLKLLEKAKEFKSLKAFVYSGAGCAVAEKTFDIAHATPEDAPISLDMDSPYSISKIIGEFYCVYYHNQFGIPTIRARFQNVYGPGEVLGAGQWRGTNATIWRNVVPIFVYKALKGEPLPVEGDGEATRDFIYVGDIVEGLIKCADIGEEGEVYNLASGKETSIRELAENIIDLTGGSSVVEYRPRRTWDHSGRRYGSPHKSRIALKFEAQTTIRNGLASTIEWTKLNMDWIDRCIEKHIKNV